jgi:hypothetical protein
MNALHWVCGRNSYDVFSAVKSTGLIHSAATEVVENGFMKACQRAPPTWYPSTVYSIGELALKGVTEAIDRLDASLRNADSRDLEGQVAAVWALVGEMDPELAKLASRYTSPS